jgi:hypothetical protein
MVPTTKRKQREFLDELIGDMEAVRVDWLAVLRRLRLLRSELHNRPQHRGRRSAPPTDMVRHVIQHLHETTEMSQQEIAIALDVSNGRVSEILRGKRS